MRRASATGLLDNLGGEGQPLPESHGRDSSMGQAAIQQLRRVARRGPGTQHPGARLSPFSPRPDPRQDYSTRCEYALQRYTAPCSAPPCAQATRAGLDCGEVRGCAQRGAVSISYKGCRSWQRGYPGATCATLRPCAPSEGTWIDGYFEHR